MSIRVPLFVLPFFLPLGACDARKEAEGRKSSAPAIVPRSVQEDMLSTVILTPEAEARLGVRTAAVEYRKVERRRTFGGEVVVPPGRSVTVSTPLSGTLREPAGGKVPRAGERLRKGQEVFTLLPLLSATERVRLWETRVGVEGEVEGARVRVEAAVVRLERSEKLLQDKAGSARALDEARAEVGLARAALKAAETRRDLLQKALEAPQGGALASLSIESPQDGILRSLHALPAQTVPAGAPLFEVLSLESLWIRVPVHAGDLAELDQKAEAQLDDLSGAASPLGRARPVPAPPSAHADAATVDLFYETGHYEAGNQEGRLRPGQKVGVSILYRGEEESLVVPWAAVLHDIHGGTWVYERARPHAFTRHRVEVRHVAGSLAVLGAGPEPGTMVVTDGAAEIFGAELGFGDSTGSKTPAVEAPGPDEGG